MSYIGTEPKDIRSFGRTKFDYTATQGQTAFTGADDDGKVLAFTVGQIEVYVNGILMDDSDFTTTGTGTVTLASAANLNDVINIVSFESNIPDNDYVPASGGTFTGNVTNSGTVTNSGNVTVGGTLGVTGATTMSGDLTVSGNEFKAGQHVGNITNFASSLDFAQFGKNTIIQTGSDSQGFLKSNHYWNGSSTSFVNSSHGSTTIRTNENNDGQMWFETAAAGANPTARLKIDNAGRVTMPSQIGFSYLGSKSYVISGTGTTAMSSSNVWASNVNHAHNRGSHFNASTGRFTCPIAGRYQFHFRCQASNFGSGYLWFYMRLNQSVFSYSQKSQENAHTTQYLGGILELNANDYIDVAWTNNYVSGQIHYPEFTGYLIG